MANDGVSRSCLKSTTTVSQLSRSRFKTRTADAIIRRLQQRNLLPAAVRVDKNVACLSCHLSLSTLESLV